MHNCVRPVLFLICVSQNSMWRIIPCLMRGPAAMIIPTLLEWYRKSEFTADRSSLLVVQDPQVLLSLMMKFAGGTLFQRNQMDTQEFLKQADLYEEVDANILDRIYKMMLVTPVNHPLTIVRAPKL